MILKTLATDILELLREIESLGFRLCLVGGAVRDFLLTKELGKDLDFEIRAGEKSLSPEEWEVFYKKLPDFLSKKNLAYTSYPYLITTLNYHGHDLEFSSPRLETAVAGNSTHHHFIATLDSRLDYRESFKRRDLTINAIGIEINITNNEEHFLDPFDGINDLNNKVLRHIDEYFFEDGVRFLRLIRFSLSKNDFTIFPGTFNSLSRFNLSGLPIFHLKKEMLKSHRPAAFLNKFRQYVQQFHLPLNSSMLVLLRYSLPEQLTTIEQIVGYLTVDHESEAMEVGKLFSLPEKKLKDCKSFLLSFRSLQTLDTQALKVILAKGLEDIKTQNLLKDVKNLHEKKDWFFLKDFLPMAPFNWEGLVAKENPLLDEVSLKNIPERQRSLLEIFTKLQSELKL